MASTPDQISVSRKEFDAFLAENQELVERCERLIEKVDSLTKTSRDLSAKLNVAEQRLASAQGKAGEVQEGDETLRKARATMARLIEATEKRLAE